MIQNLTIKNFKSIKDLNISCKKLNVFIGEPNSGKSNIIEAFALQSQNSLYPEINKQIFRYKTVGDLYYDFNIDNPIEVKTEKIQTLIKYGIGEKGIIENIFRLLTTGDQRYNAEISHEGKTNNYGGSGETNVRYYEYKRLESFSRSFLPHLSPPHGDNLPSLLLSKAEYKKWVSEFLKSKDLKLTLKPTENEILASKFVDDEIYPYPYIALSETIQRIIFYSVAVMSNKNSIILLDEPDTNTFPLYTKDMAERIALDESNQFFITTHNPYLLLSLIEKSKEADINIYITQMKNYKTVVNLLTTEQISEVLDLNSDVFFNFDNILSI